MTNKGREQAKAAGEWMKKNMNLEFDRLYTSEYLRAMETAALLDIPNAVWYAETFLRERDFGVLDLLSEEERQRLYPGEMERRKKDRYIIFTSMYPSIAVTSIYDGKPNRVYLVL
jgi:NAD+ kinase